MSARSACPASPHLARGVNSAVTPPKFPLFPVNTKQFFVAVNLGHRHRNNQKFAGNSGPFFFLFFWSSLTLANVNQQSYTFFFHTQARFLEKRGKKIPDSRPPPPTKSAVNIKSDPQLKRKQIYPELRAIYSDRLKG